MSDTNTDAIDGEFVDKLLPLGVNPRRGLTKPRPTRKGSLVLLYDNVLLFRVIAFGLGTQPASKPHQYPRYESWVIGLIPPT